MSKTVASCSKFFVHRSSAERLSRHLPCCADIDNLAAALKQTRIDSLSKEGVRHLALDSAHDQAPAADCVAQARWGSDQPENKNAGGEPPALGKSPNWKTQVDYTAAPCELLETLLPELLEEVLLEVAESAKECRIGLSLQMPFELQVGQLDSANVVSNLGKTITACNGILIDNRLAGDARCNRPMNRFGHNALPAVASRDIKNAGETPGSWRTSYSEDPITLYHEPERLFNSTQSRTHVLHY